MNSINEITWFYEDLNNLGINTNILLKILNKDKSKIFESQYVAADLEGEAHLTLLSLKRGKSFHEYIDVQVLVNSAFIRYIREYIISEEKIKKLITYIGELMISKRIPMKHRHHEHGMIKGYFSRIKWYLSGTKHLEEASIRKKLLEEITKKNIGRILEATQYLEKIRGDFLLILKVISEEKSNECPVIKTIELSIKPKEISIYLNEERYEPDVIIQYLHKLGNVEIYTNLNI